jgi:hypothetical protein
MLRILRGLDSRALPCGCLVGVYETYRSQTVAIIDVKGSACTERGHRVNSPVEFRLTNDLMSRNQPPSTIPTSNR